MNANSLELFGANNNKDIYSICLCWLKLFINIGLLKVC